MSGCHTVHNRDKNATINLEKCVELHVLTTWFKYRLTVGYTGS